jgi:hypothetical protein
MKEIFLTRDKFAFVDDDDYEWLNQWKWYCDKRGDLYYAARAIRRENGKWMPLRMHRAVLKLPHGDHRRIDHIDRNGLNNTKSNLRICSHQNNMRNRRKVPSKTSTFKGVFKKCDRKRWYAAIGLNKKTYHIGVFDSEIEAAKAYDVVAQKYFGEFARLNFPKK